MKDSLNIFMNDMLRFGSLYCFLMLITESKTNIFKMLTRSKVFVCLRLNAEVSPKSIPEDHKQI
jgi:hypothetical protein